MMQTAHFKKKSFLCFYLAVARDGDDFESDKAQSVDDDSGGASGGVAVLRVTVVGVAGEVRELNLQGKVIKSSVSPHLFRLFWNIRRLSNLGNFFETVYR